MKHVHCPKCHKQLIRLEPYEDGIWRYWCDKCNLDITIEDNDELEKGNIKLKCTNCGKEFEGSVYYNECNFSNYYAQCPECKKSFDVELPKERFIMGFEREDRYLVHSWYSYDTPEEFLEGWRNISKELEGSPYWVLDNKKCICCGACDPDDIDIYENRFGRKE